jgi:hypothetical protein
VTDPEHHLAVNEFRQRREDRVQDSGPAVPGATA